MGRVPKDPREIFQEVVSDYRQAFGEDLSGIILYGSAAREDYRPGKSDINFLIVLSEKGIQDLSPAFSPVKKWRRRSVAVPLFLTKGYLETSLDVFPLEYLNIRRHYVVAYGEDILKDLSLETRFVRLQCEREIKGKLLLLRESYLESSGKGNALGDVIGRSVGAIIAVLEGLLYIQDRTVSGGRRKVVRAAAEVFAVDAPLFEALLDIREGVSRAKEDELRELFRRYLQEVAGLAERVDRLGGEDG